MTGTIKLPFLFTPIACFLFLAAIIRLIPLTAMWLSELIINTIIYRYYYSEFVWLSSNLYWVYGAFGLIALLPLLLLRKVKIINLVIALLLASRIFFLLSNLLDWISSSMYDYLFRGFLTYYTVAIPFFSNTLLSDFIYCSALFGVFEVPQYQFPLLGLKKV